MKKEQDKKDADVGKTSPPKPKERDGASQKDRRVNYDPPSDGGGGNTTDSDI